MQVFAWWISTEKNVFLLLVLFVLLTYNCVWCWTGNVFVSVCSWSACFSPVFLLVKISDIFEDFYSLTLQKFSCVVHDKKQKTNKTTTKIAFHSQACFLLKKHNGPASQEYNASTLACVAAAQKHETMIVCTGKTISWRQTSKRCSFQSKHCRGFCKGNEGGSLTKPFFSCLPRHHDPGQ